jgi:hypothetical protein
MLVQAQDISWTHIAALSGRAHALPQGDDATR